MNEQIYKTFHSMAGDFVRQSNAARTSVHRDGLNNIFEIQGVLPERFEKLFGKDSLSVADWLTELGGLIEQVLGVLKPLHNRNSLYVESALSQWREECDRWLEDLPFDQEVHLSELSLNDLPGDSIPVRLGKWLERQMVRDQAVRYWAGNAVRSLLGRPSFPPFRPTRRIPLRSVGESGLCLPAAHFLAEEHQRFLRLAAAQFHRLHESYEKMVCLLLDLIMEPAPDLPPDPEIIAARLTHIRKQIPDSDQFLQELREFENESA